MSLNVKSFFLIHRVMLYGKSWKVANELSEAQTECFQVADILDTAAIVGEDATKNRLLSEMREATILHIGNV